MELGTLRTSVYANDPDSAGRGLGLAALLGIMRGHKGGVVIDSAPGRGTRVTVCFPPSEPSEPPVVIDDRVTVDWRGSGTILVVEDEQAVREVVGAMLGNLGFKLLIAKDGREGVELFRQHTEEIVLVLLDLKMPEMDGEEALASIRGIQSDAKVILSSGYAEEEAAGRPRRTGPVGFIQKPYQLATLQQILRETLSDPDLAP